jgi:hypothetical protein
MNFAENLEKESVDAETHAGLPGHGRPGRPRAHRRGVQWQLDEDFARHVVDNGRLSRA